MNEGDFVHLVLARAGVCVAFDRGLNGRLLDDLGSLVLAATA